MAQAPLDNCFEDAGYGASGVESDAELNHAVQQAAEVGAEAVAGASPGTSSDRSVEAPASSDAEQSRVRPIARPGEPGYGADAVDFARAFAAEVVRRQDAEAALQRVLGSVNVSANVSLADADLPLRSITDSLPLLVSYIDGDRRYRFVNRAYEHWFGQQGADIIGRRVADVLGPAAYGEISDYVEQALRGESVSAQLRVPYDAGERFVDVKYLPHVAEDGTVRGFAALISDITESKRLELERQRTAERSDRLMKVTAAIAEAVDTEQVLEAVVDRVALALGASSAGLWIVSTDGQHLNLVRSLGYGPALLSVLESSPLDRSPAFPALDAVRRKEPLWISSPEEMLDRYPHFAALVVPNRACGIACLPLLVQGNARGSIAFSFRDERMADPRERDFLLLVARYAGQALERLRLLETERALRAEAEAAAARLAVLGRASSAFAEASPHLSSLFSAIAEQVTDHYADGCCIVLVKGQALEVAAVSHRDPDAVAPFRESLESEPLALGRGLLGQVAQTGEPVLLAEVDPLSIRRMTAPSRARWMERYLPRSLVIVPLTSGGVVVGALSAMRHDARPFTLDDQRLLEELADRATVAIAAGRLYEANEQGRVRAELLYELAAGVIRAKTVDEVFDVALDGIERALGASRCSILAFDASGVMRFRAWRGLSERYRTAVEGHSPWDPSTRDPAPIVVPDVQADAELAKFGALFDSEQIGALGFIPLVSEGRLIGKFMVYYPAPRELSAAELDMSGAIANHVAAAMGRFSALRELEQTVRFNEIFTGMLGHELRNPLGAIMTAAQIAARRSDPGVPSTQLARPLSRILKSGERMAKMIDQLLDFTRVRVGDGIPLEPHPADAVQLVRQAMDELSDANPNIALVPPRESGRMDVVWDSDRVLQVFSNLVANAVQHCRVADPSVPDPGVTVHVDGSRADSVSVSIHNMGEVPAEILPRLFEPMAGGDRRRDNSRGLGLGLYISREIVKAHAGAILVESSVEGGTTFTVRLPRVVRAQAPNAS